MGVFLAAYSIPVTFDTLMRICGGNSIANVTSVTPGGAGVDSGIQRCVSERVSSSAYGRDRVLRRPAARHDLLEHHSRHRADGLGVRLVPEEVARGAPLTWEAKEKAAEQQARGRNGKRPKRSLRERTEYPRVGLDPRRARRDRARRDPVADDTDLLDPGARPRRPAAPGRHALLRHRRALGHDRDRHRGGVRPRQCGRLARPLTPKTWVAVLDIVLAVGLLALVARRPQTAGGPGARRERWSAQMARSPPRRRLRSSARAPPSRIRAPSSPLLSRTSPSSTLVPLAVHRRLALLLARLAAPWARARTPSCCSSLLRANVSPSSSALA